METDITPANSDLIALIESQLLGTELHVKGYENITMHRIVKGNFLAPTALLRFAL